MLPITHRHSLTVRNQFTQLNIFQFSFFDNIVVNLLTNSCNVDGKSKRFFVVSSKCRQISVQFSNFEHQFVILPIHVCRTPCKVSRDDTQVKDEHLADSQIDNDNVLQSQQHHVNNDA